MIAPPHMVCACLGIAGELMTQYCPAKASQNSHFLFGTQIKAINYGHCFGTTAFPNVSDNEQYVVHLVIMRAI